MREIGARALVSHRLMRPGVPFRQEMVPTLRDHSRPSNREMSAELAFTAGQLLLRGIVQPQAINPEAQSMHM